MKYNSFCGHKVSNLGFGCMRLPTIDGKIDFDTTKSMIDYAIANGVNYFDTAFPYHAGWSELVVGEILEKYPRDSFFLASKFPGHQVSDTHYPNEIFEQQLKKCRVDYFDFYLLHNVYEQSINVYKDPKWGIVDYFIEQKRLGRIKHLGFSSHGSPENLKEFLSLYGKEMEFCQIQINYLDYSLQNAEEKYKILLEQNLPIIVMEPIRGGRLANLSKEDEAKLRTKRPDESPASWALRWTQCYDNLKVVLSGMSNPTQVKENIKTFSEGEKLSEDEKQLLFQIADGMKNCIPCTACRYCMDGCPKGLNIPMLIKACNDIRFGIEGSLTASMQIESLPEDKRFSACIGCGACSKICPQKIDVPSIMVELKEVFPKLPKWGDICRAREKEYEKIREDMK